MSHVPVEDQGFCTILDFVELNVVVHEVQHLLLVCYQQAALDPASQGHSSTNQGAPSP